jgi:hypothetical protein
MLDEQKD